MAPFKQFFRLGQGSTSRSTSQENEPDQPANLVITTTSLNKLTTLTSSSAHYLTVDESDQNSESCSLMSMNNDQRALLSSGSTADQIGYSSPQLSDIPISPPPSYEAVMKENQLLALDKENNTIQPTIHTNLLVENFYATTHGSNNNLLSEMSEFTSNNHIQSLSSPARENLLIDGSECTDEECNRSSCNCINNEGGGNNNENCDGYDENCLENDMQERCSLDDGTQDNYSHDNYQCSEEYPNECQNQYQDDYSNQYVDGGGQQQQQQMNYSENKGPEILYKSSKQLYKAVAKQCGITCKMTDTCRCVDCQSRYFDCEFDHNDNEKTDGGLSAGTPMFINEVLHGTACTIL